MRISIILPWYDSRYPSGGVLNIYKYAKLLAKQGHYINIIYNCDKGKNKLRIPSYLRYKNRKKITTAQDKFEQYNNICEIPVYCVNNKIPSADFVIATALITVPSVKKLNSEKGKKVYFIQGFENWVKSDEYVYKSYELGMINIAVSKWLYKLVDEHSIRKTYYLPNAVDDNFMILDEIEKRDPKSICFMYVPIESKGTYDLLKAINLIHESHPDTRIEAFGIYPNVSDLPSFITYTYNPSRDKLNEIYNRNSIFVCASWLEGFGLTAAESMKSGCCLITTDNKGVRDFAEDGLTALVCEPKKPVQIANAIEKVLLNNDLRIKIAKNGLNRISDFNWDKNIKEFNKILKENI